VYTPIRQRENDDTRINIEFGPVAQRLEQQTHNLLVVGSSPTGPTRVPATIVLGITATCEPDHRFFCAPCRNVGSLNHCDLQTAIFKYPFTAPREAKDKHHTVNKPRKVFVPRFATIRRNSEHPTHFYQEISQHVQQPEFPQWRHSDEDH
jgi:hypothetical protein